MMKPIPISSEYFADTKGNIWSKKTGELKKLTPGVIDNYFYVWLYHEKKRYTKSVHSLILEAFVGPRPKGYWARHRDGNPKNNNLSNLSWDTISNNHKDKIKHGTDDRGEKSSRAKLTNSKVIEIRELLRGEEITQPELAKLYSVSQPTISAINTGKNWRHIR